MASRVVMPKLTDTMEEGVLLEWKKREGDHVQAGEALAEIETDKAVMDLDAFASGILRKILVQNGETVESGTLLGVIGEAIRRYERVDIGIAVGMEDGLITPVIRDCGVKTLETISAESRALIERAKQKRLQPQEYSDATSSISNLGMFEVEIFSPSSSRRKPLRLPSVLFGTCRSSLRAP